MNQTTDPATIGSLIVNGIDYVPKQQLADTAAKQLALEGENATLRSILAAAGIPLPEAPVVQKSPGRDNKPFPQPGRTMA